MQLARHCKVITRKKEKVSQSESVETGLEDLSHGAFATRAVSSSVDYSREENYHKNEDVESVDAEGDTLSDG